MEKINKSEVEWERELTPEEYEVLRKKGTEAPFSGAYVDKDDKGVYTCKACGFELFSSDTKYHSGSGWPSFYAPLAEGSVETAEDNSHGMHRVEVTCPRCGSHLGHVFDDGPSDKTGKRYCINSCALDFEEEKNS